MSSKSPRPSGRGTAVAAAQRRARRLRTAAVVGSLVAVVAGVAALSFTGGGSSDAPSGYSAAKESFDLPSLTGDGHVRLADHAGHPVVVNFFASWCVYCNQELPGFAQVATATRGNVDFIGVQSQDTGDGLEMAQRFGLAEAGFELAQDVGGTPPSGLWTSFGGQGLPVTAFFDDSGTFLELSGGMLTQEQLEQKITDLFGVAVSAQDAADLQAPVIPLIPQGAAELMVNGVNGSPPVVLDVRAAQEFAAGHIPNATNLDPASSDLDDRLADLDQEAAYIVYDGTGSGSAEFTAHLHELGFKHVYDLQGGLAAWTADGLPTQ